MCRYSGRLMRSWRAHLSPLGAGCAPYLTKSSAAVPDAASIPADRGPEHCGALLETANTLVRLGDFHTAQLLSRDGTMPGQNDQGGHRDGFRFLRAAAQHEDTEAQRTVKMCGIGSARSARMRCQFTALLLLGQVEKTY